MFDLSIDSCIYLSYIVGFAVVGICEFIRIKVK